MADKETSTAKKYKLRIDKVTDDPVLVITNQVKLFCNQQVQEQTELELLTECIHSARMEDRTEIMTQDIPSRIQESSEV